jgi:hypothetical protein
MSPFIDKLTAVGLILVLAMAPLQGLMAATLKPHGLGIDMHSITLAQNGEEMPAETVSHDCFQNNGREDGSCCEPACSYGHCGVCFTTLNAGFMGFLSASSAPERTQVLSDAVSWLSYPSFRPPRF